jgi:hypothetical protein
MVIARAQALARAGNGRAIAFMQRARSHVADGNMVTLDSGFTSGGGLTVAFSAS